MKTYFKELKNIFIETFKYIHKNKFMIIPILLFAFPIFVLCFAFSTTYAYEYDTNNNNLVGNDLLQNVRLSNVNVQNLSNGNYKPTYNLNIVNLDNSYTYTISQNYCGANVVFDSTLMNTSYNNNLYLSFNIDSFSTLNFNSNDKYYFCIQYESTDFYTTNSFDIMYWQYTTYKSDLSYINYNTQSYWQLRGIYNNNNYYYYNNISGMVINGSVFTNINLNSISFYTKLYNYPYNKLNGSLNLRFMIFKCSDMTNDYLMSNNNTFYPYSSIEQLQQDYNTLQSQYNTLQNQYNTLQSAYSQISNDYQEVIDNYNTLRHQYDALQQDYNTLQIQYNIYVATHSYTDTEYNELNNQYQTLQSDYNSLVSTYFNLLRSYNDLQDRYDSLIAESTNAMYFALNGATANLYTDVSGTKTLLATDTVSINQSYMNFDNSCIPNINTYLNAYDSSDTTNYPNPYCYIEIELNMSVNSALLFTFDNSILDTDITLSSTISDVTTIYNRNSELNPYQLVVNSDRLSFNKITYDGIYMPDYISIDFSLQLDGYSYSLGYEKGVASQQSYINSLNSSVSTMQASINTLRASNQQLQEQVNNTFGWKNLFFAMADTPFKTISNVLGFELFGLNLFTTFIGMITVFAIVWLLKKFI